MMRTYRTLKASAAIVLALALGVVPASLVGCGTSDGGSQQGSAQSQAAAQREVPAIEVAGCRLVPEKLVVSSGGPSDANGQDGFSMLVLRMEEGEVPVYVTPFGAVSGFNITLGNESAEGSSTAESSFVRFEPLKDAEGSGARVTFYYKGGSADAELPNKLYYGVAGEGGSHTYQLGSYADQVPVEKGQGEWPAAATQLTGLSEGAQNVPLNSELVLVSSELALDLSFDAWANDLFRDCCKSLVSKKAMAAPQEGAPNEYLTLDPATGDVVYLDQAVADQLSGDLQVVLENVVFFGGPEEDISGSGVYHNDTSDSSLAQYPLFYPATSGTSLNRLSQEQLAKISPDQAAKFAKSLDGCRYVVGHIGLLSRVDKDYYNLPTADRKVMTTFVVVMDTQTREFVHIHKVGVDEPPASTDHTIGKTKTKEALDYMFSLL